MREERTPHTLPLYTIKVSIRYLDGYKAPRIGEMRVDCPWEHGGPYVRGVASRQNSPYLGPERAREDRDEPAIDSALEGLLGNHQNALP